MEPVQLVALSHEYGVGPHDRSSSSPEVAGLELLEVAQALAASPHWQAVPDARLLVRLGTKPVLGVVGRFDAAARRRLLWLRHQLMQPLPRTITYGDVERSCERLAEQLEARFGLEQLRGFRFVGIPRGGLIVLGILSYCLDLRHAQLAPPKDHNTPVVVVDDCAISGWRFGEWLRSTRFKKVVFAHLYSPRALRTALEGREPRVTACIAAHDLVTIAEGKVTREPDWETRGEGRYWIGATESIAFPWSEPDSRAWNPETKRDEAAWRLTPPGSCIRSRGGIGVPKIPLEVLDESDGPFRAAPGVLIADMGDSVLILDATTGRCVRLTDTAADMWRVLVTCRAFDEALAQLEELYASPAAVLRRDLTSFARDLSQRSILTHSETIDASAPSRGDSAFA